MPRGKGAYLSEAQKAALARGREKGMAKLQEHVKFRKERVANLKCFDEITMPLLYQAACAVRDKHGDKALRDWTVCSAIKDNFGVEWHEIARHYWMVSCLNMVWPMRWEKGLCALFSRRALEALLAELGLKDKRSEDGSVFLWNSPTFGPVVEPWIDNTT